MSYPYLSDGNMKVDVPTWSLPAVLTCPTSSATCRRRCYARKAEYLHPHVRTSRFLNLVYSLNPYFIDLMSEAIERKKSWAIRIHESGDFYNQDYLDKWVAISLQFPAITFLAYTRNHELDFSAKPNNLILYHSSWWNEKQVGELQAVVYPRHGQAPAGFFKCPKKCKDCHYCFRGVGNVAFEQH